MIFTWDSFNADQLEAKINELSKQKSDLDKLDLNIAAMYARKCKKETKALLELMKVGGWMNASEALEWGFIDEIADCDTAPVLTDSIASALAMEGIPVPDIPVASKETAFGKFLSSLTTLFQSKTSNNAKAMPIKSNIICKVLGIENLESKDGVVSFSEAQIASLENAFEARDNTIKQHEDTIADLTKRPADDTKNVVNSSSDESKDEITEFTERMNNTRELFNSLI